MPTFHSGKLGTATVGGTELAVVSWTTNPVSEFASFRNSKTGNFSAREATFKDLSGTVVLDYDFDQNIFAAPVSIVPGTTITNLKLFVHGTTDTANCVTIPSAVVTSTPVSVQVEGKIGLSFDFMTNGSYTLPGAIAP